MVRSYPTGWVGVRGSSSVNLSASSILQCREDRVQADALGPQGDERVVQEVGHLFRSTLRVTGCECSDEFGGLFAQLLESEIRVIEKLYRIAAFRSLFSSGSEGRVESGEGLGRDVGWCQFRKTELFLLKQK